MTLKHGGHVTSLKGSPPPQQLIGGDAQTIHIGRRGCSVSIRTCSGAMYSGVPSTVPA